MVEYINQSNQACTKCPELVQSRKRITWGYGNIKSPLVFIGEAPGYLGCDRTGIPFRGDRSGNLYERMLKSIGFSTETVYTTNAVKCCPPGNRTPTDDEVANCRSFILEELRFVDPKIIVPMGRTAIKLFVPYFSSVTKLWDQQTASSYGYIFFIPHPAYIVRDPRNEERYTESFKKIRMFLDQEVAKCSTS